MERFEYEKIRQTLSVLQGASRKVLGPADAWFRPGKPDFARAEELRPFGREETWGGWDCDGWFRFFGTIPGSGTAWRSAWRSSPAGSGSGTR